MVEVLVPGARSRRARTTSRRAIDPDAVGSAAEAAPDLLGSSSDPRSARVRITRLIRAAIIALVVSMIVSVVGVVLLHERISILTDAQAPKAAANTAILQAMTDAQSSLRGYLIDQKPVFSDNYRAARIRITASFDALDDLTRGTSLHPQVEAEYDAAVYWLQNYAEKVATRQYQLVDQDRLRESRSAFDAFRGLNKQVTDALDRQTTQLWQQATVITVLVVLAIAVIGAMGMASIVRPGLRALHAIGPPLERLYTTVRSLRGGDLQARADPRRGVVEIRAVAAAVNELADVNQRHQEHLSQQLRLAEVVHQLGLSMGTTLSVADIVDGVIEPLHRHLEADLIWLRTFTSSPDGAAAGSGDRGTGASYPRSDGVPSDRLIAIGRRVAALTWRRQTWALIAPDVPRDDDLLSEADRSDLLDYVGQASVATLLIVPVGAGTECLGYLALGRSPDRPRWNGTEISAVQQAARDLGRAVLHARIFAREAELVDELQALNQKKSDFVSMVSHELRTPLSSIVGHLENIRTGDCGEVPDEVADSLTAMDRNSTRLTRLIEDLLLLSRIEGNATPVMPRPVDLTEVVADVVGLHREAADRAGVILVDDSAAGVGVLGEVGELERVVGNLLSNAIKFSPHDATVNVAATRSDDGGAVITVRDQGLGISAEDQEEIFGRFFRSTNPAAHAVPGTGLGLTITRLLVDRHHGSIGLDSTLGTGTTFTVVLPAAPPA